MFEKKCSQIGKINLGQHYANQDFVNFTKYLTPGA